jgi:hypothetical protein
MSRIVLAASFAVLVASAVSLSAQQGRPDLSGRWTLVPDLSTPAGTHAFGTTLIVNQSADTITLEQQVVHIQFADGPSGSRAAISETGGTTQTSYVADGNDHDVPVQPAAATAPPANVRVVVATSTVEKSYRAVWNSKQLIIMTRDAMLITRANSEPIRLHRMIRLALTLSADGSLIGESLIVADPMPAGFFFNSPEVEQPAPVPVRSVYRR